LFLPAGQVDHGENCHFSYGSNLMVCFMQLLNISSTTRWKAFPDKGCFTSRSTTSTKPALLNGPQIISKTLSGSEFPKLIYNCDSNSDDERSREIFGGISMGDLEPPLSASRLLPAVASTHSFSYVSSCFNSIDAGAKCFL